MKKMQALLLAAILSCYAGMAGAAHAQHGKKKSSRIITGWVEKVHIDAVDAIFTAKLDTGAMTSSIDAEIVSVPEKNAKTDSADAENSEEAKNEEDDVDYVIFSVKDNEGEARTLKRPISRWVRIKKKDGGFIRRPVITMTFCIAGQAVEEEVNLADRDHFNYPVLIGRNMLEKAKLLIDASRKFTADPSCPAQEVSENAD